MNVTVHDANGKVWHYNNMENALVRDSGLLIVIAEIDGEETPVAMFAPGAWQHITVKHEQKEE